MTPRGCTAAVIVRDLGRVITRENAQIGVLIIMHEPTQPMKTEPTAGFYESPWNGQKYPRLQIRTVEELLGGKDIDYPTNTTNLMRS